MTIFRDLTDSRELVDSFTRPASTLLPVSRLRDDPQGDDDRWASVAELGWLGIGLPEDAGGVGLTLLEEVLAAQTFGRHLLSTNFLATVLAAHAFAGLGRNDLATGLVSGVTRATLGWQVRNGSNLATVDAGSCDYLLVLSPAGLDIYERPDVVIHDDVHWGWPVALAAAAPPAWTVCDPELVVRGQLLIAAMLAGIAGEACDRGVEYAKVREQFGQPIGAFQAVKHHCANMAIAAHAVRELVTFAALSVVEGTPDAPRLARAALNLALRAAGGNAGTNIQVHGGMGFSDECDAHLFLKTARVLDAAAGGIDAVRRGMLHTT